MEVKDPHNFCETPGSRCTMSYCDDNGCQDRVRSYAEPAIITDPTVVEVKQEFNLLRRLRSRLSMKKGDLMFLDIVNGIYVFEYKDCFGDLYMAQSKWGVRCKLRD